MVNLNLYFVTPSERIRIQGTWSTW